jgi:hypothetical protein
MSKIGNYVVELQELTDSVMALEPFGEAFAVDDIYGCAHCLDGRHSYYEISHHETCPVIKLREVLTKQGSK